MFKEKDGSIRQKLTLVRFMKLLIPKNYELHPTDLQQLKDNADF